MPLRTPSAPTAYRARTETTRSRARLADFDRVDDDMGAAVANAPHLDAAAQRPGRELVEPPLEQPLGLELRQRAAPRPRP